MSQIFRSASPDSPVTGESTGAFSTEVKFPRKIQVELTGLSGDGKRGSLDYFLQRQITSAEK